MTDHTTHHSAQEITYGYCHCGCGQRTNIAKRNDPDKGWRKGEPMRFVNLHGVRRPLHDHLWGKVQKGEESECWLWQGSKNKRGYGRFRRRDFDDYAHRVSYEIHFGAIPEGMKVCHRCDNPPCVNPNHLFLGTSMDNCHDMMRKGRHKTDHVRGEANKRAKLTEGKVYSIRSRVKNGESVISVAKLFGIERTTVYNIVKRKSWRHLKEKD